MQQGITYVPFEQLEKRVLSSRLPIEEKKGWLKVMGPGGKIYIPKRKMVGRVDIDGFATSGFVANDRKNGRITQLMDMRGTQQQVLATFDHLLKQLANTKPLSEDVRRPVHPTGPAPNHLIRPQEGRRAQGSQPIPELEAHGPVVGVTTWYSNVPAQADRPDVVPNGDMSPPSAPQPPKRRSARAR